MTTRKLKMGMVGGGKDAFIGAVHRFAANLDGRIELVAGAFSSSPSKSHESGALLFLNPNRVYDSFEEMAKAEAKLPVGQRVDFVSIVTPNFAHFPAAKTFLEAIQAAKAAAKGKEMALDLRRPDFFEVARPRQIEVSPGDKILIRANDKRLGLTNGQVLTVSGIAPDGALQTKEGQRVLADFRQWCHGYVVTSHKAQGWTADHVVIAAESFTSKGAYVACSRGRKSCIVHTPDKARLIERLPEGDRRAALDALPEIRPKNASIVNRVRAWKRLSIDLAQRFATQVIQPPAAQMRIAHPQKHLSQSL